MMPQNAWLSAAFPDGTDGIIIVLFYKVQKKIMIALSVGCG